MAATPIILGVNRTQDASICLMNGSTVVYCTQKERLTRQKHHWGKLGDFRDVYARRLPALDQPIDVLVECYSSDREIEHLREYDRELEQVLTFAPNSRRARISHHLAHLYSVFYPSPFDEAATMIIDGQGSPVHDFTEPWSDGAAVPGHWREVSSFYACRRGRIECLDKQLWDCADTHPVGLGMFYFLLTQAIFPGEGHEGKVMGLAPYGNPQALGLPPLTVEDHTVQIPRPWTEVLGDHSRFRFARNAARSFADVANLAAAGQKAFEEALLEVAGWLHRQTGASNLCFAGGIALNCSANDRLWRESPFERLFIPPAPSDAGTALGCAVFGLIECLGHRCPYRWTDDFLGPEPRSEEIEATVLGADGLRVERPEKLIDRMVDFLVQHKVLGLFQGRSEFGPRALGHRSILADPRHPAIRDWINQEIKGREWFRPLAPVVLLDSAPRFFDIHRPSPFMQFAAGVKPESMPLIPAVTHVDGTARLQTVGHDDDPFLYSLLKAFEARTGIGVLLNTSFNRQEEPIVETAADALRCFRGTPMHALAMPPFLIRKPVEPESVAGSSGS